MKKPKRARRRRRRLHSVMLAGATTLFVPHAGKILPKAHGQIWGGVPVGGLPLFKSVGLITTSTSFRLPPELEYEDLIQEAARRYKVNPDLVRAVIRAESAFDALAVSTAGAQGLMQLMPALSQELGVRDPFDPRENVMAGTHYLAYLLDNHHGDVELALASYNAGPAAVDRYNGVPPFPETQQYIKTVTGGLLAP